MRHGCRLGWAALGVISVLLVAAPAVPAAAPANDDFSASLSTTSSVPTTFTGTLDGATAQPGEPNHAGAASDSGCTGSACMQTIWWGWRAPRSALVTMSTCDRVEGSLDTQLAVYTGDSVGALHEVVSNDDAVDPAANRGMCPSGQESVVGFRATAGTSYRIAVAGRGSDQHVTLHVSYGPFAYIDAWPGIRVNPERLLLTFRVLSPEPGAQVRCRIDADPFADCPEYARFWDRPFTEGAHTLEATATAGGDTFAFPSREPFIVDTTPPETSPDGPPKEMSGRGYWWEIPLVSSERNQEQYFACSIDGVVPTRCAPAFTDSGAGEIGLIWQCVGEHTVDSSAVDAAGNVDPSPMHTTVTVPESAGTGACAAPTVTDGHTHFIGPTGAYVGANVAPHGLGTDFTVEYGKTTRYGQRTAAVYANGSTTAVDVDGELYFLDPATTYHARLVAANREGTGATTDQTFTILPPSGPAPSARAAPASHVTAASAALNGFLAAPDACHTTYFGFELGTDTSYGLRFRAPGGLICDADEQPVRLLVAGLRPGTTYHYRLLAASNGGVTRSGDMAFTTFGAPAPSGGTGAEPVAPSALDATSTGSDPGATPPAAAVTEAQAFSSAPLPPPAATANADPVQPTVVTPRLALRAAVTALATRLRRARAARSLRVTFVWPTAGRLTLRWHAGRRTLGTGTARRARAGRQTVALRLTRTGRAAHRPSSVLEATFTPARGRPVRAAVALSARRR